MVSFLVKEKTLLRLKVRKNIIKMGKLFGKIGVYLHIVMS